MVTLQMLVQRQELEQDLNQRIQKMQAEKNALSERVASLQRTLAAIEGDKREMERASMRLEKDKNALKKCLDKVSWGRLASCICSFRNATNAMVKLDPKIK